MRERNLFLAITIPDDICPGVDDPDVIADEIVSMLNVGRTTSAWARQILDGSYDGENPNPGVEPIMVDAIPSPQWLTPETLATLRASAEPKATNGDDRPAA